MNIIGDVWHPGHLEDKAEAALRKWLPSALEAAIALDGESPEAVPLPKSWTVVSDEDGRWPENSLPAVIITSSGMVGEPDRGQGNGEVDATWSLEITAICRGRTWRESRRRAQLYWSAICVAMLQRRSLGDDRYICELADSALDAIEVEKRRTLAGATALFHVQVRSMFSEHAGPLGPDVPDPIPDEWPEVTETSIEMEIE